MMEGAEDVWGRLAVHHAAIRDRPILSLFEDGDRAAAFSVTAAGMLLDWSKTNIDAQSRALLLELAGAAGVEPRREAMFTGGKINETETRAVLHAALRNPD